MSNARMSPAPSLFSKDNAPTLCENKATGPKWNRDAKPHVTKLRLAYTSGSQRRDREPVT